MEGRKLTEIKSDKNLIKIKKKEKKDDVHIARTKKKSKTIIDTNLLPLSSHFKYSEYLDQNADFCDYMEDCALSVNNFNKESFRHLFCIFDGHGGNLTAKLCVKKYPEIFRKCLLESPFDYEMALKKSFYLMDKEIESIKASEVGNTATVVFINNRLLYCANVGDSSCALLGKTNEFISIDDKCTDKNEIKRIEKAGGTITEDRLGGILAISRGLGDFDLKSKGFICEPHITKKLIDHNLNYCVLASDGVWDVLKPDEVWKLIQNHKIDDMAKLIVETAIDRGSEDNISCIVIELNKRLKMNK
jgi:serine/threonine protein phosphatase PrpC